MQRESGGEGQLGLPFAIYPSELYYQPDMFDEAGLDYPPATYGTQYKMPDGTMADWSYDTLRQVAMKLTVDNKGKDELGLLVAQKKVVAFRDQDFADLPIEKALDFGRYFGRLHIHPTRYEWPRLGGFVTDPPK